MTNPVSYTINGYQPVKCTCIGDDPMFYQDDEYFTDEENSILCNALDDMSAFFEEPPAMPLSIFLDHSLFTFKLSETKELLWEHPLLSEMMEGIQLILDHSVDFYEINGKTILLNPHLHQDDSFLVIAKCLRLMRGVYQDPMSFHPDHAVVYNRVMQADADVFMCRIAWEMYLMGFKRPHNRLLDTAYYHLAGSVANCGRTDFRTRRNGTMMQLAMEQWFLEEHCNEVDRLLIKDMLANNEYFNEPTQRLLTPQDILPITETDCGNYLASTAHIILEDPVFTEVRDRSSANFLWFIKFEQSFKQTEQEKPKNVLRVV